MNIFEFENFSLNFMYFSQIYEFLSNFVSLFLIYKHFLSPWTFFKISEPFSIHEFFKILIFFQIYEHFMNPRMFLIMHDLFFQFLLTF